jgi:hypothetical protein
MLPFIASMQSVLPFVNRYWRTEEAGPSLWCCSTGTPTDSESYLAISCSQFYVKHFYSTILVQRPALGFAIQDIEGLISATEHDVFRHSSQFLIENII